MPKDRVVSNQERSSPCLTLIIASRRANMCRKIESRNTDSIKAEAGKTFDNVY